MFFDLKRVLIVIASSCVLIGGAYVSGVRVVRHYDEDPDGVRARYLVIVSEDSRSIARLCYWSQDWW